jgi:hypothetical protein
MQLFFKTGKDYKQDWTHGYNLYSHFHSSSGAFSYSFILILNIFMSFIDIFVLLFILDLRLIFVCSVGKKLCMC